MSDSTAMKQSDSGNQRSLRTTLDTLKENFNELRIKVNMMFVAGLVFWGGAQFVVTRELNNIDEGIKLANTNSNRLDLIEFKQDIQEDFNSTIVDTTMELEDDIREKFLKLERRLDTIHYRSKNGRESED